MDGYLNLPMSSVSSNLAADVYTANSRYFMTISEEQQLVMDAKVNSESFGKLYDYYFPKVYNYVAAKIRDKAETEDLVGEIFMKIFENLPKYEWRGAPFGAWVFAIARNTLNTYFGKASKNAHSELDDAHFVADESQDVSPKKKAIQEELSLQVQKILKQLPERELNVIQLKFFAQLSNREIVEVTGLSESHVAVIIFRTLKKIKPDLQYFA
jgi:RNA polymerase sigma-70 factor, ECF subfamily